MALLKTCVKWKNSGNKLPAVPWSYCWNLTHPTFPLMPVHSISKVAGEMHGVNSLPAPSEQHMERMKKYRRNSFLPSSSANPVALSQGQGEYWSGWRISAKHFKICWKMKRTYFYNSTLGIVNFSAKFLDRNDDFDCYISDI